MLRTLWTRFAIHRLVRIVCKHAEARMPILGITWFGAYWIHPRHLAIWIEVDTDAQRDALLNDRTFMDRLRALPAQLHYPAAGRAEVGFGVASKETVDRDCDGSWYLFYK
jgi:hypothetical protein